MIEVAEGTVLERDSAMAGTVLYVEPLIAANLLLSDALIAAIVGAELTVAVSAAALILDEPLAAVAATLNALRLLAPTALFALEVGKALTAATLLDSLGPTFERLSLPPAATLNLTLTAATATLGLLASSAAMLSLGLAAATATLGLLASSAATLSLGLAAALLDLTVIDAMAATAARLGCRRCGNRQGSDTRCQDELPHLKSPLVPDANGPVSAPFHLRVVIGDYRICVLASDFSNLQARLRLEIVS